MMNQTQLINAIHAWLQRFGNRNNDTFYYDIGEWHLSLQYHFDLDGEQYEPYSWVNRGSKLGSTTLETYDEKVLQDILTLLLKVKKHH
jgi:hypothetical protein